MAPLLEIENLRTEIRLRRSVVHAIDGVSLHVDPGECLGIVGESGSGKTMTALSIMRLLPVGGRVVDGRITLADQDLTELTDQEMTKVRGNEVGMVFQDPLSSLNPTMTIGSQIAEAVLLHRNVSRAEARERAIEVLGLVGMDRPRTRLDHYPHQFSGGMRQRAMIAMALACEPKLLIADEPTTALDVTIQKQILDLIDGLRKELGMSVILVTHDLGVIAGQADRIAVMYAGKIAEETDTETLFANPRHPYTEALFEALPDRVPESGRLYSIPGLPPDLTDPPPGCRFAPRCRHARPRCTEEQPALLGERPGHHYACFYPVGETERRTVAPAELLDRAPGDTPDLEPLLQVTNLVKTFPVTAGLVLQRKVGTVSAVSGVSFEIPRGRTFGLVGESGCGKTTIGRLIVGLERPDSGEITFDGTDNAVLRGRARKRMHRDVQLMFQDSYASMDPRMRVGTILREPLAIQRIGSRQEQRRRIAAILDQVGLPKAAVERYPHEFSGGQRQRLGLARALVLQPRLIVADEPVSALDVSIQAQILNEMRDLQERLGLTYLFISHDLAVVRYLSTVIGVMYLGKLVETGPAEEVYLTPAHPYTKGLIDTIPVPDPEVERAKLRQGVSGELPSAIAPPSGCRFRTRCPYAQEICAEQEPPLRLFSAQGHQAACHFPLQPPLSSPTDSTTDRG